MCQAIEWSKEFKDLCDASGAPPDVRVLVLSADGKITGVDGAPMSLGHFDDAYTKGILPFPAAGINVKPLPLEELRLNRDARCRMDDDLVNDMLAKLGLGDTDSPAIKAWRNGQVNISGVFAKDSYKKKLTCYLPSTASMPEAVYSPDVIYQAPQ